MTDDETSLHICSSCLQAFASHRAFLDHANGPFATVDEAEQARIEVSDGDRIPAGVTVGHRQCYFPGEDLDPEEWTTIEQGDLVYDRDQERYIGIVGHRDDATVDVETWGGATKHLDRGLFTPDARYLAIR